MPTTINNAEMHAQVARLTVQMEHTAEALDRVEAGLEKLAGALTLMQGSLDGRLRIVERRQYTAAGAFAVVAAVGTWLWDKLDRGG